MRVLLTLLLTWGLAGTAYGAASTWKNAHDTAKAKSTVGGVSQEGIIYDYDETHEDDSPGFTCLSAFCLLVFNADTNATGTSTGQIFVRGPCSTGTFTANYCERFNYDNDGDGILDSQSLNGDAGGTTLTDRRQVIIPRGWYYIETSTNVAATEDGQILVNSLDQR